MLSAFILLAITCTASAEETADAVSGVETNVYFCKMIEVGDNYDLEPLPTLFMGTNNLGRLIFAAGSDNLEKGDYALVQNTPDGIQFIQTLKIEPSGSGTPEYVILKLQIREEDLKAPLEIYGLETEEPTLAETNETPAETTVASSEQPESTMTPLNTVSVLMAGFIAVFCVFVFRNKH